MEFLLILSAVLSAITGAFSGVRAPEVRLHHAATATAQAATPVLPCARVAAPAARPAPARSIFALLAEVRPLPLFALTSAVPLYADRLIE
jgi:hypothetical protein